MILFWGVLSLLQIAFLPGLIALRHFHNKHMGFLEKIIFSFALSLIINFLIVFLLTSLGIYQRLLVLLVFFGELILAFWLYRSSLFVGIEALAKPVLKKTQATLAYWIKPEEKSEQEWQKLFRAVAYFILMLGAISTLVWIFKILFDNKLTVFTVWDSVVSWNRWATDWFSNQIPDLTRRYGQLIPANWSISYIFIGSSQVQFFAKSIMPLFTLFILILPILLGLEFKSYGYFAAAILIQLMFKKFLGEHVSSGYVDTAVSFFSFASLYCLIKASFLKEKEAIKSFLSLGVILAAGAFVTKQPGLFVLATYPVLAYFLVIRNNAALNRTDFYQSLIYPFGIALAISLPWYVYTEITIFLGRNKTEFEWILEEVFHGKTLGERFILAVGSLEEYSLLFLFSLISLPLLKGIYRWIFLFIILPYSIFWALYASYSHRNLAIIFPLLALVSGMGLEYMVELFQRYLARINFKKLPVVIFIVSVAILGLLTTLFVPDSKLIDLQVTQQKDILLRGLNRELYDYFETTDNYGLILSGYPLEFLPGFERSAISDSFEEYDTYSRHREENPGILYLLMPKSANDEIFAEVMHQVEVGEYVVIFEQNNYLFIRIVNISG